MLLDPANQALLQKVLTYHVIAGDVRAADLTDGGTAATVQGGEVTFDLSDAMDPKVNGVSIVATDIVTENGVIHLIDGVLTDNLDIVDVATVEGCSTLVSLVDQQDLTATLRTDNAGDGFTVFAPTDAAFAALAAVPSGQALTDVLLYHAVSSTRCFSRPRSFHSQAADPGVGGSRGGGSPRDPCFLGVHSPLGTMRCATKNEGVGKLVPPRTSSRSVHPMIAMPSSTRDSDTLHHGGEGA